MFYKKCKNTKTILKKINWNVTWWWVKFCAYAKNFSFCKSDCLKNRYLVCPVCFRFLLVTRKRNKDVHREVHSVQRCARIAVRVWQEMK